jgi:hypothetical protein
VALKLAIGGGKTIVMGLLIVAALCTKAAGGKRDLGYTGNQTGELTPDNTRLIAELHASDCRCKTQADRVKTRKRADGAQHRFAGNCFAVGICLG